MHIFFLWQIDKASDPQKIRLEAEKRDDVVCISALSGDGVQEFCNAVLEKLKVQSGSQS
jgi:GTP-binding protein HflX